MANKGKRLISKYGFRLLMTVGLCLFVSLCAGCRTVSETRREDVVEKAVGGSDVFMCKDVDVRSEALQDKERFQIRAEGVHNYKIERNRVRWNEIKGERYYSVAGVHKEYNLKDDVVADPMYVVVAATLGNLTLLVDALGGCVTGNFDEYKKGCAIVGGAYLCILPGISGEGDFNRIKYVSTNNVSYEILDPRIVSEPYDVKLKVTACSARGKVMAETNFLSAGLIVVPVCDEVLKQSDSPSVSIKVEAGDARIEGTNSFTFTYDLETIVERKLAADPKPSSYAPAAFALSAPKLESRRRDGRLEAGMEGALALPVANTGTGDGYKVVVDVVETTGDVQVSKSKETLILRAGKAGLVDVPFSIPVQAQDGTSTVRLVATDALGRKSPPLTFEIPYAHRAMPKLMLTGAELIRSQSAADEYYVDVGIRNKGDGRAEKVGLSCDSDSTRIHVGQTTGLTDDIAPRDWRTVRISAKIPNVTVGQVLKIKLAVAERFGVGGAADEFEVVVPE